MKKNFNVVIHQAGQTVFTLKELSVLLEESNFDNLKAAVHYYVKKNMISQVRRGVYAKDNYDPLELAIKIYPPAYIGFEFVLFKEGLVFQYDETITVASYLSREIRVGNYNLRYRKVKESILTSPEGLEFRPHFTMAGKERAFLDILYLNRNFYVDYIGKLDRKKILKILPIYENLNLEKRVRGIFK
ncbi:MAG: hypothetical protein NT166_10650 [Candidatus Aminicenantes bacterium]|nr:hypothetical protein [Candidatus Aminicenantes bacterium]